MSEQVNLSRLARILQPGLLLVSALVYSLGAAIAHYLGSDIHWGLYWVGQVCISLIQVSKYLLNEYFKAEIPAAKAAQQDAESRLPRLAVLASAAVCLTVAASLSLNMLQATAFSPVVLAILLTALLEAFFFATPPYRWSGRGYGELSTAITGTILPAALSLLLQHGNLHRLLAMTVFPLAALEMAMLLVQEFPHYGQDVKFNRSSLVTRMGWEQALTLHNILVLTGFGLLGAALLFGLPLAVGGPAFLTLPIAAVQIWLMLNLANGAKPNWRVLLFSAASLYALCTYLLAFSFWTH